MTFSGWRSSIAVAAAPGGLCNPRKPPRALVEAFAFGIFMPSLSSSGGCKGQPVDWRQASCQSRDAVKKCGAATGYGRMRRKPPRPTRAQCPSRGQYIAGLDEPGSRVRVGTFEPRRSGPGRPPWAQCGMMTDGGKETDRFQRTAAKTRCGSLGQGVIPIRSWFHLLLQALDQK